MRSLLLLGGCGEIVPQNRGFVSLKRRSFAHVFDSIRKNWRAGGYFYVFWRDIIDIKRKILYKRTLSFPYSYIEALHA
jgi:hypothetical protein